MKMRDMKMKMSGKRMRMIVMIWRNYYSVQKMSLKTVNTVK